MVPPLVPPLVPQCFGGKSCGVSGSRGLVGTVSYLSCDGSPWRPGQSDSPVLWHLPAGRL